MSGSSPDTGRDAGQPPEREQAALSKTVPSLEKSRTLLARSRLLGRVSACIFLLAALAVIDGLQTLVRHEFNSIDLLPGESVLVSGMLPADAKSHEDLHVEIAEGSGLSFVPTETYKGFWMGGHMWRAELSAAKDIRPGTATITVVDIIREEPVEGGSRDDRDRSILFGGRQNPALVHTVTVWASEEDRRAADNSLFRRFTGLQPFVLTAVCVILALAFALANWRVFCLAENSLAAHGVFVVHGVKDMRVAVKQALPGQRLRADKGTRVAFFRLGKNFDIGEPVLLLDRQWRERARGRILDVERTKAHALFDEGAASPAYGWLVTRLRGQ